MSSSLNKTIYEVSEESGSKQITVLTTHLKIDGYIHECEGHCKEISSEILTLTDAVVCNLSEYCACDEEECECNDYVCLKYDWLNISLSQIVAFSIIK